jgi:Zn-dependent metalloprotease
MIGNILVFSLILTVASANAPAGCMFPKDNNLMAAPENEGPFGKRSFPPDADLRLNPENGTIQYLKGKNLSPELAGMSSKSERPFDIALSFLELYKTLFKLQQPHDELRCIAVETDELGLTHVRFQQIYQAVPVWANELNVHLDQHNRVYLVQGRYIPTPQHVNTQPAISVRRASEIVFKSLGVKPKDVTKDAAELIIYVKPPQKTLLAYKVNAPGWIYFVDAVKGDIIDRIARRQTVRDAFVPL